MTSVAHTSFFVSWQYRWRGILKVASRRLYRKFKIQDSRSRFKIQDSKFKIHYFDTTIAAIWKLKIT